MIESNRIKKVLISTYLLSILFSQGNYYSDRIMVYIDNKVSDFWIEDDQLKTSIIEMNNILKDQNVRSIDQWLPKARLSDRNGNIYLNRYYIIEFESNKNNIDRIITDLMALDEIMISEKIPIVEPAYIPDDPLWDELYGLSQINAHLAFDLWDIDGGEIPGQMEGGEVVVAIPDIGLKWDHPDLIDNVWQNLGEDADGDGVVLEFINNEWVFDPDDENGVDDDDDGYVDNFVGYDAAMGDNDPIPLRLNHVHGTKVAGNVSAMTNNGIGLASVGYSVKLMGVNANNNIDEPWYLTHTNQAVLAAAQMGADIINCSWVSGYSTANENFYQSIHNGYNSIIMGAAGNGVMNGGVSDTTDFNPRYPAAYDNVVSVTAMGDDDSFNCWSNVHETVDISAPGEFIICAYTYDDTLYALGTGTSYATPLTAGAIALVKSVIPDADNETIISKVINTAEPYPDMDRSCGGQSIEGLVGSGQLNIHRAVLACTNPEILAHDIGFHSDNGFLNPGDTIAINMTISNSLGFENAENVIATLTTSDAMLTIVNDQIIFNDIMVNGEEQLVEWIVIADSNALLGDIPFNIHFAANAGDVNYENNVEFHLPLSYGLFGYPIEGVNIKTSPILSDLDGNSLNEIYFASDSTLHGKWVGGFDVPGFPLTIESTISSSIAVGDLEGDGDNEIIFGSFAGVLHALDKTGTEIMSYLQDKPIIDFPVLSDLDQDGDLEIVFISVNDTASSLFVIDHNGEDIDGFPIEINERLIVGPAVADLDNDMTMDIVVTTLDSNIYVVNGSGVINDEFPIISSSGFTTPATLVDLDGDQDLEILAGTESGDIYMYHHDGTTMNFLSFGSPIIGGISIADIDADGNFEIIFGTQNGHMHAWDPIEDAAASGWPVQSEQGAISEPITVDLDNDGDLEIVYSTINGGVAIIHHDGNTYDNFPSTLAENIFSTPTIGDLDNDGDFELIIGTSSSLQVVDIEEQKGDKFAWSVYRSNNHRNGYFDITLASIIENESNLPIQYSLGRNYPNPFNPRTTFSYSIPKRDKVTISIYDMKGRIVKTLLNNQQSSGSRSISWNATNHLGIKVSSGVYFYRMQAGRFSQTNKMVLLK